MDYEASLDRALEAVPDPAAQADGAFTRFDNLEAVADALNRTADHLHRFVQRSLATSGKLEAGETYTVEVTDTGRKGDGVAHRGDYTIFVPGTSEGDVVEIVIEDTSGDLAFSRLA